MISCTLLCRTPGHHLKPYFAPKLHQCIFSQQETWCPWLSSLVLQFLTCPKPSSPEPPQKSHLPHIYLPLAGSCLGLLIFPYSYFKSQPHYRRRRYHPTPVLLPGKSHGRRSLVGCSPWGRQESDTTERLHFHLSLLCIGEGNGNPLQCSCLENPRDGVAQSWTRLKWLSSSSNPSMVIGFPGVHSDCASRMRCCYKTPSPWMGLPRWLIGKESTCQCRRCEFDPWVGKIP